jgi:hypothetical protein
MTGPIFDWSAFFAKNPELSPPGYDETVAALKDPGHISAKKAAALEAAEKKKDKNRKGRPKQ